MNLYDIKLEALTDTLVTSKISDQEYFSEKYSAYVSNSRLGNINPKQNGSPEKFFSKMENIYSDSLILGSAVHTKVLQSELFELVQIERPNAKLGFVCDYIWDTSPEHILSIDIIEKASEKIGYYKNSLNDKKIDAIKIAYEAYYESRSNYKPKEGIEPMFLSPKLYETAIGCINACVNNNNFTSIMHPLCLLEDPVSENEQAFLMDFKCEFPNRDPIIIKLKSKLDNYTIDFENNTITVNDLKTIGAILPKFDGKEGNFGRFHYSRELSLYLFLLKQYVAKKYGMMDPQMKVNCLVVSTISDYYTKVYEVSNRELQEGFNEFKQLMRLVAYYIAYKGYELN